MKLFQIEEPEGGPSDPSAPGAAIGIDASGTAAEVAFSVGGNAMILADREGFERLISVPVSDTAKAAWRELFEAARVRAERALARPVTHAVVVVGAAPDAGSAEQLHEAAREAGLVLLHVAARSKLQAASTPALAVAILAEDLAPRGE